MDDMPIIKLKSGLRVGNFSSPHSFTFETGEVLPACSSDRARLLMLDVEEKTQYNLNGWTDIILEFQMSGKVEDALFNIQWNDVDLVVVPLPVRQAIKNMIALLSERETLNASDFLNKYCEIESRTRVCRVADRVSKKIRSDAFCK